MGTEKVLAAILSILTAILAFVSSDYAGVVDHVKSTIGVYDHEVVISMDNASTTNDGKFEGWGTSLCWWANRVGYSDKLAQDAAEMFFSEDGLNLNIMRYNIGGGDDPTHKHITRTDSEVPGWLYLNEETGEYEYDYTADKNQLNVLERAYKAAGDDAYVEVFSNSPPYFMTNSGCASGATDPNHNNLRDDCYTDFANYLAHVSAYINNQLGIKVSSISAMNEPNTDYWGAFSPKQEGCHYDIGESQSKIIVETAKAFESVGLGSVEVVATDDTAPVRFDESYNALSDEAKSVIDRYSTHTYYTVGIDELGALAKEKNMNLWMSEVDGNGVSGTDAGEMGPALWLAGKILEDLDRLSPSAWVMWQVIDSHKSKDGYNGNQDWWITDTTNGFWGTCTADHDAQEIIKTQKYYAFGQFSKFIRPGSRIIHIKNGTEIAAYNEETKQLVIVGINYWEGDSVTGYKLDDFKLDKHDVSVYRTSGSMADGEHWENVKNTTFIGDTFCGVLKANSVTTFVIENVELK